MKRLATLLLGSCALWLAACSDSDTSGGGTKATSTSAEAGTGGAGASSSSSASSGGSGGQPTGGGGSAGNNTGSPTVMMTVDPTSMHAGDTIDATVTVTNFKLVPPKQTNIDGEGHYHIY